MDRRYCLVSRWLAACCCLLFCVGCSGGLSGGKTEPVAAKGDAAAAVALALSAASASDGDDSPEPVSDKCENCDGAGKVGDGRVMVECRVCRGTGKNPKRGESSVVAPVAVAEVPVWTTMPPMVAEQIGDAVATRLDAKFSAIDDTLAKLLEPAPVEERVVEVEKMVPYKRPHAYIEVWVAPKGSACLPCEEFKRMDKPQIEQIGWTVQMHDALPGLQWPTNRVWIGDKYEDWVGRLTPAVLSRIAQRLNPSP